LPDCPLGQIEPLTREPHFYACDALSIEAEDLTRLPPRGRKRRLLAIMPTVECRLLYLDHLETRGVDLFPRCAKIRPEPDFREAAHRGPHQFRTC
jgi:hypothetical protein